MDAVGDDLLARQRYEAIVGAGIIGLAIGDERGVTEANDAFLALLGRTREDVADGRLSWAALTPPKHAAADARAREQLRTRGRAEAYETEYRHADGHRIPVLASCVRLAEEPLQLMVCAVDLSDRRAIERQRDVVLASEQEARRRLSSILSGISDAFFAVDPEWRFTYVNPQAEVLLEHPAYELLGRRMGEAFPALRGSLFETSYRRAMEEGEPVAFEAFAQSLDRWFEVRAHPSADGLAVFFQDITERKRSQARSEALRDLSDDLVRAVEPDEIARVVVGRAISALGASAGSLAFEQDADTLRLAHHEGYEAHVGEWGEWPRDFPSPVRDALRTRELVLLRDRAAWAERYPALLHTVRHEAYASVPLLLDDAVIGCLGLSFDRTRTFSAAERDLLREVAARCAQAVERGRLYHERSEVARTLQAGLLPRALPEIPGVRLAAHLEPLGHGSEVGGDFYDVVELGGGRWLVAMGDVCGKGPEAALVTALARHTLEAVALLEPDPARVLLRINEGVRRHGDGRFLSMVLLALDVPTGRATLVSAGHPPVLRLRAGEAPEAIQAPGMLLGVDDRPPLVPVEVELAPGDTLVLYTDGVTEARVHGDLFGESRLMEALATSDHADPAALIARVRTAVRSFDGGRSHDDQALLVVHAEDADGADRVDGTATEQGWTLGYRSVS